VDLYEGVSAETPEKARELMSAAASKTSALEENLKQAYAFLDSKGAPKIGVAGWCFGGAWALKTALLLPKEIDALTIYYGRLVQDRQALAALKMPILGIFAERDQGIPVSEVRQFESSLEALGKPAQIIVYPDVDHAFANPSGGAYAPEAAADAWEKTLAFFQAHLQ
jgi:carboxymethylenebutenolidase